MTTAQMIQSFMAFNINAKNSIIYIFQSNLWLILIAICTIATAVMYLREEIEDVVTEEQNIL